MLGNYDPSEALVIADEGSAFTNNPKDAGGPTRYGVTMIALADFLGRPVSIAEVQALTPDSVKPIYKANYWTAVRGDELPAGVDYFLFDAAVQHGRGRAVRFLQSALLVDADGDFGDKTKRALDGISDTVMLITRLSQIRRAFYQGIPSFDTFGKGWTARLARVTATSTNWARN
jgi:lysozyme family protein